MSWGKKKRKKSCVSAQCLCNDAIHQIPDSVASLRNGHGLGRAHPWTGNEAKRDVQTYWCHRDRPRSEGDVTLALVSLGCPPSRHQSDEKTETSVLKKRRELAFCFAAAEMWHLEGEIKVSNDQQSDCLSTRVATHSQI